MSVRMNAILGDRKQVVLMSPEEIETQTHSVQAAVTNERRFPSADSFSPKKKINVKQRANETENNHHRSTFFHEELLSLTAYLSFCSRNYFYEFVRRLTDWSFLFPKQPKETRKRYTAETFSLSFFSHQTQKKLREPVRSPRKLKLQLSAVQPTLLSGV